MSVCVRSEEDPDFVVLVWTGQEGDPPVLNPSGVGSAHTTRVISGRIRITYDDGRDPPIELGPGEEITLEIRRGYTVESIGRGTHEVRCFYPKSNPEAVAEIAHLRTGSNILFVPSN